MSSIATCIIICLSFFILLLLLGVAGGCFFIWSERKKIAAEWSNIEIAQKEMVDEEQDLINKITGQVTSIDQQIQAKIDEVHQMNTVTFECPCGRAQIPMSIDLSGKENTYVCSECGNEYKIYIQLAPVLRGKVVNEAKLYEMLTERSIDGE